MSIRKAKPTDSHLLSRIAYESKSYWGYSPEFMEACRLELTVSAEDISSGEVDYYVYQLEDEIIGFYAIKPVSKRKVELEALFVKPDFIGKAYGKALLNHAISNAIQKNFTAIEIQGDPNAEKFYLASGAKLIGKSESGSIKGRFLPVYRLELDQNL
ncbi:MAG: GNAT family N-acetyltransferase [Gammaproteobacteria bacterium]|jgi:GNAT superfamily N-acetyltransferase